MRNQPAGWYRDTERPNLHRYWNGERWTERIGEELRALLEESKRQRAGQDSPGRYDERYRQARAG